MVLDAAACSSSSGVSRPQAGLPPGLLLQPCQDPLALHQASQAALGSGPMLLAAADAAGTGGPGHPAAAAAAAAGAAPPGEGGEVAQLQQQVSQLQQQLQEARRVAEQWQSLHGQLHQFCTEQVLAAP